MHAVAVLLVVIAMYAVFFSFCKIAADTEVQASRYRRRVARARAAVPAAWRISGSRLGVARGR